MEIVLPPAPPTAPAAVVISGETPIVFAVDHWNCENVRFETVFEPATNAPRAPINGAKKDHAGPATEATPSDRKSTRLNSSHVAISYAVFCLNKKMISRRVRGDLV